MPLRGCVGESQISVPSEAEGSPNFLEVFPLDTSRDELAAGAC